MIMRLHSKRAILLAGVSGLAALSTTLAHAADPVAPANDEVDSVIVTGTRTTGLRAVDSAAPITVLGADVLKRTGQPDLIQSLAQNIPSMQAQAFGGDASAFHLSIKLRGLSPNHTLVLINGKRRHGTANVVVSGGAFGGNAAADIGLLAVSEIDHVEVLQEGAAAQYGTDAIAGVVNIILKKNTQGGSIVANVGRYIDEGGKTGDLSFNIGMAPIENSYLNVTLETKYHGFSFRGDVDPRVISTTAAGNVSANLLGKYPLLKNAGNYPYVNRIPGDAEYRQTLAMFNAGYEFSDDLEFYTFGTAAYKWGQAYENFRLPNVVLGKMATDIPYPSGFSPKESIQENDYALTGGFKGTIAGWNWDLSTTYGYDIDKVYVLGSANASLYNANSTATTKGFTPETFHDGDFWDSQWTNTLDVTHDFDVGLAEPLTVAGGLEYRKERYAIVAGDPASYFGTGAQSFFGYSPVNAGEHQRTNVSEYVDFATKPIKQLSLDLAVRHEHYSDFGSTTVAKITGRYDFNDMVAVRGTASTGFRAPTLAEEYYSGINVGPTSVSGVFAPNSPGAKFLGVSGLGPEKSKNYSVGFVTHPGFGVTATLDLYQIEITDRIVQSGGFTGYNSNVNVVRSPSVIQALTANGVTIDPAIYTASSGSVSVVTFVNGVDTRSRGADFVATFASDFSEMGRVDWSLTGNYNQTRVLRVAKPPSNVDPRVVLLDKPSLASLESQSPLWRVTAGAFWTLGNLTVNLRESAYGKSFTYAQDPILAQFDKIEVKTAFITDLEASYALPRGVKVSVGANNLFNKYPNKQPDAYRAGQLATNSSGYVTIYPNFSPFGINGGYYYAKVAVTF